MTHLRAAMQRRTADFILVPFFGTAITYGKFYARFEIGGILHPDWGKAALKLKERDARNFFLK